MLRDAQLLHVAQMALLGAVVVAGMFYLWKTMQRMENKIDRIGTMLVCPGGPVMGPPPPRPRPRPMQMEPEPDMPMPPPGAAMPTPGELEEAEGMMRSLFGGTLQDMLGVGGITIAVPMPTEPLAPKKAVVEEIPDPEPEPEHEPEPSEAGTATGGPLSRSRMKRMHLDTLQGLCRERGLSDEGSKAQLIERILASE